MLILDDINRKLYKIIFAKYNAKVGDRISRTKNPKKQDAENIKVRPNATISEIKKKAKEVGASTKQMIGDVKKYKKGNFLYLVSRNGNYIRALYTPSYKKKLTIMFEWYSKNKKWTPLTYRKGDL